MNTVIIFLIILAIVIFAMWVYLVIFWMRDTKKSQSTKKIKKEAEHLSRQAKLEAEQQMAKAVEKQHTLLQKSLQSQSDDVEREFKKSIQEVTSKNIMEFGASLEAINASMRDQLKVLAEASQKQTQELQKSLTSEQANIKAKAIAEIDNNIAEIMVSYLAEVAGDLDYYQQKDYLYSALEANKEAIKKDIENAV